MFPFQNQHGYQTWLHQNRLIQQPSWGTLPNGEDSIMSSASKVEKKSTSEACKSHKEAERRRRQRINGHLSTLRTIIPNTTKTDKASLLAEVVHQVKELRQQAADVVGIDWNSCSSVSDNKSWPSPAESGELTLSYCDSEGRLIKATLCCEDRPGLNRDLMRAISSVRARVVRAEMMTAGGRMKHMVVMEWVGGGGEGELAVLKRALRDVIDNRASIYGVGQTGGENKRAGVRGPVDEYDGDEAFVATV